MSSPSASPSPSAIDAGSAAEERFRAKVMFVQLANGLRDGGQRDRVRERLITMHLPLVRLLARRYANRGEPMDDLVQAGCIGLVKAVDRFDPGRGHRSHRIRTLTDSADVGCWPVGRPCGWSSDTGGWPMAERVCAVDSCVPAAASVMASGDSRLQTASVPRSAERRLSAHVVRAMSVPAEAM